MKKYGYVSMFVALLFVGFEALAAGKVITIVRSKSVPTFPGDLYIGYYSGKNVVKKIAIIFSQPITLPEPNTVDKTAFPNNDATLGFCDENGKNLAIQPIVYFSNLLNHGKYYLEFMNYSGYAGYYLTLA